MEGKLDKFKAERDKILEFLKTNKITKFEWEKFIKNYIDQKYDESTL